MAKDKKIVFCDMDDVIVDFKGGFQKIGGMHPLPFIGKFGEEEFYKKINVHGIEYWENLEWNPHGRTLWDAISKYDPYLLSAHNPTMPFTIDGKINWIRKNLNRDSGYIFCIREDKQKYAKNGDILVDDNKKNIAEWAENGGIGILYENGRVNEIVEQIEDILNNER